MMDSVCLNAGKNGFTWPISFVGGGGGIEGRTHTAQVSALGRSGGNGNGNGNGNGVCSNGVCTNGNGVSLESSSSSRFSFTKPFRSLWSGGSKGNQGIALDDAVVVVEDREETEEKSSDDKNGSWVLKILHVRSLWTEKGENGVGVLEREDKEEEEVEEEEEENGEIDQRSGGGDCDGDEEESEGCCCVDDEEEKGNVEFDKESFSRLLRRVPLSEAKIYGRMSYLGNLAYSIPSIKPANLLKNHGLRFVTSSVEKKAQSCNVEKQQPLDHLQEPAKELEETSDELDEVEKKSTRYEISASAAYNIAASAASYLQSHTKNILFFKSSKIGEEENSLEEGRDTHEEVEMTSSEVASFVATNSMTAVVAAKEETKQAVAKDLNSACSSPCEWFICDEDETGTRYFVIQGSESLASWQANLLFEPIQFEELGVLVHRGIYEAAKGIYEQMLPEVHAHLKSGGDSATFRFTGHSLGGSLSLLVNLMLLIRGEVPLSSLLPVITFGSPTIMCGGDQLLHRLGLPRSHVQAITMHRDIVPRAFSCNYPDHVAELLKAVNSNFRNHPCLQNQRLLYAPMGEILILQPEEKISPHHHLLPSGSGLYVLSCSTSDSEDPDKLLRAAQAVFFNSPHPLEILSDRSAYGSDGAIYRDHDMSSYLKSVLGVIRLELNQIRKTKREQRRQAWWPLVASEGVHGGVVVGRQVALNNATQLQPSFSGFLRTGRESLKRFSRLVASQHMHLLVLLLVPAQSLLLGTFAVIGFQ